MCTLKNKDLCCNYELSRCNSEIMELSFGIYFNLDIKLSIVLPKWFVEKKLGNKLR